MAAIKNAMEAGDFGSVVVVLLVLWGLSILVRRVR
jgi:hypothetical protein